MSSAIALLDCNNFYASCERVFDVSLRKRPVVVLSANDGCIISRSEEAKKLPVAMGAPLFEVEEMLAANQAEIFSANFPLYADMSSRVMESLHAFTPEVEVYSVDEAFLEFDVGQSKLDRVGREIQAKLYKWTGVPVSIGIAETKTLAKLANRLAKNSDKANGVLDLYRSPYLDLALSRTAIEDVWGLGTKSARKLVEVGIKTARQLRDADLRFVRRLLTVVGARIALELRGERCLTIERNPPARRSLTCSRSFGETLNKHADLREATAVFLARVAEKLRRMNLAAHSVTVFINTDRFNPIPDFYSNAATYSSAYPSDASQELQQWAFQCLQQIFRHGYEYRKAGVMLAGLVPADKLTERMYDDERWERFRRVMAAVDEINRKFGRDTIRFAVAKPDGAWRARCERRSPRYTTRFDEILCVK